MKKMGVWMLFLCVAPVVQGWSAMENRHWKVNLNSGVSLPGGNNNTVENESFSMEAAAEYQWSRKYSAGIEVGRDFGHFLDGVLFEDVDHDRIVEPLRAVGNRNARVFRAGSFLKWGRTDDWGTWGVRWVRRYFIAGAGLYRYSVDNGAYRLTGVSSTGTVWNDSYYPINSQSSSHLGVSFGFGFEVEVFGRGIAGFDLRFHQFFRSGADWQYWIPGFKLGLIF